MKVNMLSTLGDGTCGIGTYTNILIGAMLKHFNIQVFHKTTNRNEKSPIYFIRKAFELSRDCDIAHIQFEYDFFGKTPITSFYTPLFYFTLKLLSNLKGFKIITTMHNTWQTKNPPKKGKLGSIYTYIINRFVTRNSHVLVALSETIKDRLIEERVPENKLFLIPHGAKEPYFIDKQECKKKLAEKTGINPENKLVTIFGYSRLDDNLDVKGHDLFMKVAEEFNEEDAIEFLVAGEGQTKNEKNYLSGLITCADNKVKSYGGYVRDEDIPIVLNATDIMLLPYRKITVSGILNFSLAYQIPTVTSNLDYFRKIENKYKCICTANLEPKSLSKTIRSLLYDKEAREKLRKACKQYYNEYNYRAVVDRLWKVYNELVKKQGRRQKTSKIGRAIGTKRG